MTTKKPPLAQRNAAVSATPKGRRDAPSSVGAAPRSGSANSFTGQAAADPFLAASQANARFWASQAPAAATVGSFDASGHVPVDPWLKQENASMADPPPSADVRQLADQLGVRLRYLAGSGAGGRHTRSDVELAAQTQRRERARAAAASSPPKAPTATYTLPPFTASGIDPSQLLAVPVSVRPAMAAATTPAEAFRLLQTYGSMTDEQAKAQLRTDGAVTPEHGGRLTWPGA